jgi:hypothetical protein
MIMVLWNKRRIIAYRLPEGKILPAIMVQLRANTRGLGHLILYHVLTGVQRCGTIAAPYL